MAHVTYEGIRLTKLAEVAGITKQAMSELVIDLETLGYLQRTPDPLDRRAKLIGFTDKGRAAVDAAMRAFEHIDAILDARLGSTTLRTLRRALLTTLATPLSPSDTGVHTSERPEATRIGVAAHQVRRINH